MSSGRWAGSDRKSRLPADWDEIRERILRRDGWQCRWLTGYGRCKQIATDVDHIEPGDDHRDENLQSLCGEHHRLKSAQEGAAARKAKYGQKKRPPERHPGELA